MMTSATACMNSTMSAWRPRAIRSAAAPSRLRCAKSCAFTGSSLAAVVRNQLPRGASRRKLGVNALFTGIVQGLSEVAELEKRVFEEGERPMWTENDDFMVLTMAFPPGGLDNVKLGASIAINGTCLTVTAVDGDKACFDVIKETLRATNLGELQVGSMTNYERSARMGDEIGGHHVSGHVDCKAVITKIEDSDNNRRVVFEVPERMMKYILAKGFIGVDGCSLTVGEVEGNTFSVYLIPETLRVTVFGRKTEGDTVNIEVERQTQAIVDTVERYLNERNIGV